MTLQEKKDLWLKANEAYFNSNGKKKALISDAEFDALTKQLEIKAPKWMAAQGTGAKVDKKTEVALTYLMPSLTKFYEDKIEKRVAKEAGVQIIMDKLDGAALQVSYARGKPVGVVTRGDGIKGGDISFLIPYLNLPVIDDTAPRVLRCEAIMKNSVFAAKYADDAENARALVNGALNRKKPSKALKDIDIVVLGVYCMKLGAGLAWAKLKGLQVVRYSKEQTKDLASRLPSILAERRKTSDYDMDGLVGASVYAEFAYANADKPKWIYAFKVNESVDDAAEAHVQSVVWQQSRKGLWIPKIKIKPIRIGGTTVTYATLHNAKWMLDRKIGPGAVVKLVRSGDVIPKIVGVVKAGKVSLPKGAYELKGVHFQATERTTEGDVRAIHHFFKVLGMEFIASKTIDKLYDAGLTTVADHIEAYNDRLKPYLDAGIGEGMCKKIYAEYKRVLGGGVLLRDLMVASNLMGTGIGERKLRAIESHYERRPNLLADFVLKPRTFAMESLLVAVPGFSEKSMEAFLTGVQAFKPWLRTILDLGVKVRKPEAIKAKPAVNGSLSGEKVSFTGYRNKEHEQWIEDQGGELVTYGAKTTVLLYKEGGKKSAKLQAAKGKGIKVCTFGELQ